VLLILEAIVRKGHAAILTGCRRGVCSRSHETPRYVRGVTEVLLRETEVLLREVSELELILDDSDQSAPTARIGTDGAAVRALNCDLHPHDN
jgi:hypothetical protein